MKPTPNTDLIREPKFFSCYEPAGKVKARTRGQKFANVEMDFTEDTYILLDALEQDAELLQGSTLCLEIGFVEFTKKWKL